MIPPPRDAVIHQLAVETAEKIYQTPEGHEAYDSILAQVEAALRQALQVQRSKCGCCEAKEAENTSKTVVK